MLYLDGLVDDTTLFYLLVASSAQWGVFMGLHAAPLEALFGDSIESGARSLLCRAHRRRAIVAAQFAGAQFSDPRSTFRYVRRSSRAPRQRARPARVDLHL